MPWHLLGLYNQPAPWKIGKVFWHPKVYDIVTHSLAAPRRPVLQKADPALDLLLAQHWRGVVKVLVTPDDIDPSDPLAPLLPLAQALRGAFTHGWMAIETRISDLLSTILLRADMDAIYGYIESRVDGLVEGLRHLPSTPTSSLQDILNTIPSAGALLFAALLVLEELTQTITPTPTLSDVVSWLLCPSGQCLVRAPSEVQEVWTIIEAATEVDQNLEATHRIPSDNPLLLGRLCIVPHYQHLPLDTDTASTSQPPHGPTNSTQLGQDPEEPTPIHPQDISPPERLLQRAVKGTHHPLLVAGGFLRKEGLGPHEIWILGKEDEYINDEVLNTFRMLVMHEANNTGVRVVTAFFFTKLLEYLTSQTLPKLTRWFKDGFSCARLVVPIHTVDPPHWSVGVVDFRAQRFEYLDSLKGGMRKRGNEFKRVCGRYLGILWDGAHL